MTDGNSKKVKAKNVCTVYIMNDERGKCFTSSKLSSHPVCCTGNYPWVVDGVRNDIKLVRTVEVLQIQKWQRTEQDASNSADNTMTKPLYCWPLVSVAVNKTWVSSTEHVVCTYSSAPHVPLMLWSTDEWKSERCTPSHAVYKTLNNALQASISARVSLITFARRRHC